MKLVYATTDGYAKLPAWVIFYLELGSFLISSLDQPEERRIIGLAIPTRAFSAAFSAVGAVIGSITSRKDQPSDDDYFDQLCSAPAGTHIKFRDRDKKGKDRLLDGILLGPQEMSPLKGSVGPVRMLQIQLEKSSMLDPAAGGLRRFVTRERARDIMVANVETVLTAESLPTSQKGKIVAPTSNFAKSVLGSHGITEFERETRMTCLVIGSQAALKSEICNQSFQTDSGLNGTLSDLLRVRRLIGITRPFRSDIFAANSRRPPRFPAERNRPDLVIFDGALGFLKWRDYFLASHWLVLLDQTEPSFDDGLQTLNNHYIQRNGTDAILDDFPSIPDGVEMIFFQERTK
ncbi:MAG: hypothetical protein DMF63_06425 [Acidobacteria bacterium]|nr:MAG: hypothetical protein DMF63_06425 [Acidobacteriota bacterium]